MNYPVINIRDIINLLHLRIFFFRFLKKYILSQIKRDIDIYAQKKKIIFHQLKGSFFKMIFH